VGDLIQIVDAAMAEAVRKSGDWIACKPGCMECCIGPFAISMLDAARLRDGLAQLALVDPSRAEAVRRRAAQHDDEDEEASCPALDPDSGTCDLYASRPLTCRMFGPAVRSGGAVGACELCYQGASDEEIAACSVTLDIPDDERETTVACSLRSAAFGS
jgi:Fe-S-cluster containining protein